MSAPPGLRVGRPRTERPRRRRTERPGAPVSGLILTVVIGMFVAGVGAALWLQRGTPAAPAAVRRHAAGDLFAAGEHDPWPEPAPVPTAGPPGGAVIPGAPRTGRRG
jgi:hypothetical protein